jgi:polysaccharide export outer membrane protein
VPALGRTPAQLADDVRGALEKGGYYEHPLVRVDVLTVASRYVTVLGYVSNPGLVPLDRDYRLSELIARVGGRSSAGADFVILTGLDGKSQRFGIADLATAGRDKDPLVTPGDKIYVPPGENEVFYVSGSVKSAGAFPVTPNLTVRMALARGGGVSENGNENKVKIIRKGVPLKTVDLDKTIIESGDILSVGERMF